MAALVHTTCMCIHPIRTWKNVYLKFLKCILEFPKYTLYNSLLVAVSGNVTIKHLCYAAFCVFIEIESKLISFWPSHLFWLSQRRIYSNNKSITKLVYSGIFFKVWLRIKIQLSLRNPTLMNLWCRHSFLLSHFYSSLFMHSQQIDG